MSNEPQWLRRMAEKAELLGCDANGRTSVQEKQTEKPIFHVKDLSWEDHAGGFNSFTIVFVYTDNDENYIIKGMSCRVDEYLKQYFRSTRIIYNKTYWDDGCRCSSWNSNCSIYFFDKKLPGHKKVEITVFETGKSQPVKTLHVRRVPRRWLDIYDVASVNTHIS